ncbi:MAG: peptide deformylase [Prolixibacteraceae bacterium]|mgnify:CR=1 FL=1|jgi:peptide deformylase|nr:peptide deformylase [Prolixibacteraceae bacterium]MDI9565029.1 peptide deformylase [Bacteroidota bacterium]NLT00472.1 peptide deformylase [Bacteroidales bacterium]OQB81018.1 MAG: Peptide deformylase [Bacteroidetes bacterium ADurb.Bin123]HNU77776.1 peptide deformylase [Prolixibacteraceae bacterium]
MIFPVTVYGDPVLRRVAEPIKPDYPGFDEFLESFWETMYHADGVGLAAPQVGRSIRLFVVDTSALAKEDPSLKSFRKVFINPEILEYAGDPWVMEEGCLSLPEIRENVSRPDSIRIRYQDENFEPHEDTFTGYPARVIQHEYDHLQGKLFVDYLSPLKRKILRGRLMAITKGKVTPHYQIRVPA